jgi:hypothetical protein
MDPEGVTGVTLPMTPAGYSGADSSHFAAE